MFLPGHTSAGASHFSRAARILLRAFGPGPYATEESLVAVSSEGVEIFS
jgi:hypothetical protein